MESRKGRVATMMLALLAALVAVATTPAHLDLSQTADWMARNPALLGRDIFSERLCHLARPWLTGQRHRTGPHDRIRPRERPAERARTEARDLGLEVFGA